ASKGTPGTGDCYFGGNYFFIRQGWGLTSNCNIQMSTCQTSYFTRRTWVAYRNTDDICSVRSLVVNDVYSCMKRVCDTKANVLDFFTDTGLCKIMHCRWNFKTWENNFNFSNQLRLSDKVTTYTWHIIVPE
ncbi:unnamed protein product, partial [Owenia fusiformis]